MRGLPDNGYAGCSEIDVMEERNNIMDNKIIINVNQTIYAIRFETIIYMEKCGRQITVHLTDGETICFYGKYCEVLPKLDSRFAHPHESFIINMQWIYRLGKNEVVMYRGDKIKLGNNCFVRLRKEYKEYIKDNILKRPDFPGSDR